MADLEQTHPAANPVLAFPSAADWEAWLEQNHDSSRGVWIRIAKKATGIPTVTHGEALDLALCFGWIDGQRKGLDAEWFLQRFTPRRPRSTWSKINREKIDMLTAAGRMRPAGLEEVRRAKDDGRWAAAYDSQKNSEVPEDLRIALEANPAAAGFFGTLKSANRYAILFRIHNAKKPETRQRRIQKFVEMLSRGETVYPQ